MNTVLLGRTTEKIATFLKNGKEKRLIDFKL